MCIPSVHIRKYIVGCKIKIFSDAFFERPYSWHDLVNNLPSRTATPPICFRKNVCSTIFHENLFQKKAPLYFRGDTMPLFYWKIMQGCMFPQYSRVNELNFLNILDLTKMRTLWQKRSVGWDIIKELECYQFKPLSVLQEDLTSSSSTFWSSSKNSNKKTPSK